MLYSRAVALRTEQIASQRPRDNGPAEALLRQAIEADPAFASAWMELADLLYGMHSREPQAYVPAMDRAESLAGSVSEGERRRIVARASARRGDINADPRELEKAAQLYQATVNGPVDDRDQVESLQTFLTPIYLQLGRTEEAERLTLRTAQANPQSMRLRIETSRIHLRHGRFADSKTAATEALAAAAFDVVDTNTIDDFWARIMSKEERSRTSPPAIWNAGKVMPKRRKIAPAGLK